MFAATFQRGAAGVELFSPAGKDPFRIALCRADPAQAKYYDRAVKGNALLLDSDGQTPVFQIPKKDSESLAIVQPVIGLQLQRVGTKSCSLEFIVKDDQRQRRRLHFSTKFRERTCNQLHAQLPWTPGSDSAEEVWVTWLVDLDLLCTECFRSRFNVLDSIRVFGSTRMRKIFSLPASVLGAEDVSQLLLPATFDFPVGVPATRALLGAAQQAELELPPSERRGPAAQSMNLQVVGTRPGAKPVLQAATSRLKVLGGKPVARATQAAIPTEGGGPTGRDRKPMGRTPPSAEPAKAPERGRVSSQAPAPIHQAAESDEEVTGLDQAQTMRFVERPRTAVRVMEEAVEIVRADRAAIGRSRELVATDEAPGGEHEGLRDGEDHYIDGYEHQLYVQTLAQDENEDADKDGDQKEDEHPKPQWPPRPMSAAPHPQERPVGMLLPDPVLPSRPSSVSRPPSAHLLERPSTSRVGPWGDLAAPFGDDDAQEGRRFLDGESHHDEAIQWGDAAEAPGSFPDDDPQGKWEERGEVSVADAQRDDELALDGLRVDGYVAFEEALKQALADRLGLVSVDDAALRGHTLLAQAEHLLSQLQQAEEVFIATFGARRFHERVGCFFV